MFAELAQGGLISVEVNFQAGASDFESMLRRRLADKVGKKFPQGNKILESAVDRILSGAIERSDNFLKTLEREFALLTDSINRTTDATIKLAQAHISPKSAENLLAQGNHVAALIEQK